MSKKQMNNIYQLQIDQRNLKLQLDNLMMYLKKKVCALQFDGNNVSEILAPKVGNSPRPGPEGIEKKSRQRPGSAKVVR